VPKPWPHRMPTYAASQWTLLHLLNPVIVCASAHSATQHQVANGDDRDGHKQHDDDRDFQMSFASTELSARKTKATPTAIGLAAQAAKKEKSSQAPRQAGALIAHQARATTWTFTVASLVRELGHAKATLAPESVETKPARHPPSVIAQAVFWG